MWRFARAAEATQWLRSNANGPTCFCLWGSIYARRAIWDGSGWRWLTDEEQRSASREPEPESPPISGEADLEYGARIDAARCTLEFRAAITPTGPVHSYEDLPLFGGDPQGVLS